MRSLEASSPKYPSPRLQFVHSNPRTLFSVWQWSTCSGLNLPPGSFAPQIAHPPFCKASMSEYSFSVIPYADLSRPLLAPPDSWCLRVASAIFSGFFCAQVKAGFCLHVSQAVAKIVKLFFFKLNAESSSNCLQTRHVFMEPLYVK